MKRDPFFEVLYGRRSTVWRLAAYLLAVALSFGASTTVCWLLDKGSLSGAFWSGFDTSMGLVTVETILLVFSFIKYPPVKRSMND